MKHIALVLVFLFGLVLKVSSAAALEAESLAYNNTDNSYDSNYNRNSNNAESSSYSGSSAEYYNDARPQQNTAQTSEQQTNIQNNNNITVGNPAVSHNQNYQRVVPPPVYARPSIAYREDEAAAAAVLGTSEYHHRRYQRIGLIPMVGGTWYATRWNDHISNSYTFGLALDVPITHVFSFEVEGGHAKYNISYSHHPPLMFRHDFNTYNVGGNMKVYLIKGIFQPYLGAGLMGVYYENMSRGPMYPGQNYNQWIGSGQLMGGADLALGEGIALGGRAAWVIPMFNRPYTLDNGFASAPYFEEAGAINTSFYKLLATLKVSL